MKSLTVEELVKIVPEQVDTHIAKLYLLKCEREKIAEVILEKCTVTRKSTPKNTGMPKVTKCTGEGQGSCKRCDDKGKWNRTWMCFLNKIEGYDGCYCNECTKEILKECEPEEEA